MHRQIFLYIMPILLSTFIQESYSKDFNTLKSRADSLYTQGNFSEAILLYDSILSSNQVASELYYNLGNCYYKSGKMPLAILNYERSLKLNPSDRDTRTNLSLARSQIQDKSSEPSEFFLIAWWYSMSNMLSLVTWKSIGLLLFVLFLALYLFPVIFPSNRFNGIVRNSSYILLAISILSNLAAYQQYHRSMISKAAIVMSESLSVKSSPNRASTDLFVVHEGTRLEILDGSMEEWFEVEFEEGKSGWVESKDIEQI